MNKEDQIQQFNAAYASFVDLVNSLSPKGFLGSSGDWTPRDIVAHLIGWNYNIRQGCQQIQAGSQPFYHVDAPNDYRTLNAEFIARYNSTDRDGLLAELARGKAELLSYLESVDAHDWDKDFGAKHYRGGAATVSRSVESLTRDYLEHAVEIAKHNG
jgi:hypothetical protein